MSNKNHRREAQGRIPKRRMPPREQVKLGTQVHEDKKEEDYEDDVIRCAICNEFKLLSEVDHNDICEECIDEKRI
jgi:hypothetical protein